MFFLTAKNLIQKRSYKQDLTNCTGVVFLEGPHYPKPHKWYGKGVLKNGVLTSLK